MVRQEDKNLSELQWLCRSILQEAYPAFRNMEIDASFYPYIGLTHTIRRKGTTWVVRISDHCRHAPSPVLEAIVMILACKVMRRRPRRQYLQAYEFFRNDPWIVEAVRERRLRKGRKHFAEETGKPLVGCGDIHHLWQLDRTFTWIYAEPEPQSVLAAIKQGLVRMQTSPLSWPQAASWWTTALWRYAFPVNAAPTGRTLGNLFPARD